MSDITNQATANAVNAYIAELQQTTRDTAAAIDQGRAEVIAIVSAASPIAFFPSHADAVSNIASIPIDGIVEISKDETRDDARTRYFRRAGNVLEFAVNLDVLRQELMSEVEGAKIVAYKLSAVGTAARKVSEKLSDLISENDFATAAAFRAALSEKCGIDADSRIWAPHCVAGSKPFGDEGDEWFYAASKRDAYTVSRDIDGLTDCHGYSDKTVIKNNTDYGGYGVFDATVRIYSNAAMDHCYSYQDRTDYRGGGVLDKIAGLFSSPMVGSGVVNLRSAVDIHDVAVSGTGKLNEQFGVRVRDLQSASGHAQANIAFCALQTTGYAFYAPGGAPSWHKGTYSFGGNVTNSPAYEAALNFAGDSNEAKWGGCSSDNNRVFLQSHQGVPIGFVVGNEIACEFSPEAGAWVPGQNDYFDVGAVGKRWRNIYSLNGVQTASDERLKEFFDISKSENLAALEIKSGIRKFKWKSDLGGKYHVGVSAQEVIRIMSKHGLDAQDYFMVEESSEGLSINYTDLSMFLLAAI